MVQCTPLGIQGSEGEQHLPLQLLPNSENYVHGTMESCGIVQNTIITIPAQFMTTVDSGSALNLSVTARECMSVA